MTDQITSVDSLFLDTNIVIDLINSVKKYGEYFDKSGSNLALLSLHSGSKRLSEVELTKIKELEKDAEKLKQIYSFFKNTELIITEEVEKQVHKKYWPYEIEQSLEDRSNEYLFIQLSPSFSDNSREEAKKGLDNILVYRDILKLINDTLGKNKERGAQFNSIKDYVISVAHYLEIKKQNHKFDINADEKIVASVFDQIIFKNKKAGMVSNDIDIKKIVASVHYSLCCAKPLVGGAFDYLCENPPAIYTIDNGEIKEEKDLNKFFTLTKTSFVSGINSENREVLREELNILYGNLAYHLIKTLKELKIC